VGNPQNRTTIRELAELVVRATGSASEIRFVDPKELYGQRYEDAADKFPDAHRLQALGWTPRFTLAQTVECVAGSLRNMSPELVRKVAGIESSDSTGVLPPSNVRETIRNCG